MNEKLHKQGKLSHTNDKLKSRLSWQSNNSGWDKLFFSRQVLLHVFTLTRRERIQTVISALDLC